MANSILEHYSMSRSTEKVFSQISSAKDFTNYYLQSLQGKERWDSEAPSDVNSSLVSVNRALEQWAEIVRLDSSRGMLEIGSVLKQNEHYQTALGMISTARQVRSEIRGSKGQEQQEKLSMILTLLNEIEQEATQVTSDLVVYLSKAQVQ